MLKKSFFKTIPFLLFIVLFNSCDKEYNVIGADLIGESSFDLTKYEPAVVSYNQKIGPIQSNNLETNALGIYDNPSFSTTRANFNTQVALAVENPTFDKTAIITSVILNVPYYYDRTKTTTNATTGVNTYELDSIYGPSLAKFKLSVYESGYFMRDLDPADQFLKPQKYYTNQNADFDVLKKPTLLNNSTTNPSQNTEFFFSPAELTVSTKDATTGVATTTKTPPGMQLDLDIPFFTKKLITEAPAGVLATNVLFKDYFRGLYFQVESLGSPANQAMIDFRKGSITIAYEETIDSKKVYKTMKINLSGNTVSLLTQSNTNANYVTATNPANINPVIGDDNLYLKGGEGSLAILSLFGAGELEMMRANKYLINQASLTFFVNSTLMGSSYVPRRIYLYNFTKNITVYGFGGELSKATAANGGGLYYKVIITNYVKNLIKNVDATNDKLGLVVAEKVNSDIFYALQVPNTAPAFAFVPMTSVMNPLGVILYGSNGSVPADKKLKMEIYYTKPN
jgi:hypothetical protein